MSKYFISFIGSHDLTRKEDGPCVTLMKMIKPTCSYLFLTKDYEQIFEENNLEEFYSSFYPVEVIYTDIIDPTNHEEIASKISDKINSINEISNQDKSQNFINLSSGTPAILTVFSLFALTGQINRALGSYAPNPKFNNEIKFNTLDFYKNSFAHKTIKHFINNKEYTAILDYLKRNKILKSLDTDFISSVEFASKRLMGDFEQAKKVYEATEFLHQLAYKVPENLYERAIEYYISANYSYSKGDYFQATLKFGIIRENLTTYLCQIMLQEVTKEEIIYEKVEHYKDKEKRIRYFNKENLEKFLPELKTYIETEYGKTLVSSMFDFCREINSFTENMVLKFLINNKEDKRYFILLKYFNGLENLREERNKLAHTLNPPKPQEIWQKNIRKILESISEIYELPHPDFEIYDKLNNLILPKLDQALNKS